MFSARTLPLGGLFVPVHGEVAGPRPLGVDAVPHAPHRAVELRLGRGPAFDEVDDRDWNESMRRPETVGGLRLTNAGGTEYGSTVAGRAELVFIEGPDGSLLPGEPASDRLFRGVFGPSDPGFGSDLLGAG